MATSASRSLEAISPEADCGPTLLTSDSGPGEPKYSALEPDFDHESEFKRQASQDLEYQSILAKGTQIDDVPNDCWSALIFIVVSDFPDMVAMHTSSVQKIRIAFALVMFISNLLIQGFILYYIYKQLLMPSFLSAQNVYKDFHEDAYHDGIFSLTQFSGMEMESQDAICGLALSHALICRILLFLWVSRNVTELSSCVGNIRLVAKLPRLPRGLDTRCMVHDVVATEKEEFLVICADLRTKLCLIVLVYIPKVCVVCILTGTGCLWLLASESFGDLILNSLALAFVTDVDEMLAHAFFPMRFQENLQSLAYASQEPDDVDDEEIKAAREARSYLFQLSIFFCAIFFVVGMHSYQPVLPDFTSDVHGACVLYWRKQKPWCMPFQMGCFPES